MKTKPSDLKVQVFPVKKDIALQAVNNELHPNLPKLHFLAILEGGRGSGKSNLLKNMLVNWYSGVFHNIYIISPTFFTSGVFDDIAFDPNKIFPEFDEISWQTIQDDIQGRVQQEMELEQELTTNYLQELEIYQEALRRRVKPLPTKPKKPDPIEKELNLIIFDDVGRIDLPAMIKFAIRHRHANTSMIWLNQYFLMCPKALRGNITDLVLFKSDNIKQMKEIADEYGLSQEKLERVKPKEMYDFIYLDFRGNRILHRFENQVLAL